MIKLRVVASVFASLMLLASHARADLQAGAASVDVTPITLPVLVNGGMTSRTATQVTTRLYARAIVLDDASERLAIVVVDSCMMPRALLDEAKQLAAQQTNIRPDHMLISATHTHTAPASMSCLGTDADPEYLPYLRLKIAEAIATAEANLEPARAGWAVERADEFTAIRRWIRRPDRLVEDPFGNLTVRANMHAGQNWDDVTGESGPEDPDLTLISIQSRAGRPIAVLANFSMHYFGGQPQLSADYFGLFCQGLEARLQREVDAEGPPFVALMSHGCSGDVWRRDYTRPVGQRREDDTIDSYTTGLLEICFRALDRVEYGQNDDLQMAEARLPMKYRVPDKQRLEWARQVVQQTGDRLPREVSEVYAREQLMLDQWQSTEVVVQAIRIGELAIASTPTETYALTGLKVKLQSPLEKTMVIDLANGGDGYIPPPEQHRLGGYNTWPARSAGLEVEAEPRIAEAALALLEQVAGQPRRPYRQTIGPASQALLNAQPLAYWRLDEFAAPRALASTPGQRDAFYEPGVVFFLAGPRSERFCLGDETNRAAHFAGGRLRLRTKSLNNSYSVSLWIWNGMPTDGRETAGWMFSRGRDRSLDRLGDHLGLGGTSTQPGRLVFLHRQIGCDEQLAVGSQSLERWKWHHVALVRDGRRVSVYLDGRSPAEIEVVSEGDFPSQLDQLFFGGRCDNDSNWEGRLDEIAIFDRALTPDEIARLADVRPVDSNE